MPDGTMVTVTLPSTWEAAFAMMAERVADRFSALDDERSREIGALHREVDDLRALVQQLTDRLNGEVENQAGLHKVAADAVSSVSQQVDRLRGEVEASAGEIAADVKALVGDIKAVNEAVDAVEDGLRQVKATQADYGTDAAARDEAVKDAAAVAQQAVRGVEDVAGRLTTVEKAAAQLREDHDAVETTAADTDVTLASLRDQVDQLKAAGPALVQDVKATAATAGEMVDEIQATVERGTRLFADVERTMAHIHNRIQQSAAGFMIEATGDLMMTQHNGETVRIGRVVGRDAVAPAALVAAAIEGDQVRFIMSDGTEHRARMEQKPVAPDPVIIKEPAKYNGHTVDDMRKMRADGLTFVKIGELCNITPQYVARLIRKAEQDAKAA